MPGWSTGSRSAGSRPSRAHKSAGKSRFFELEREADRTRSQDHCRSVVPSDRLNPFEREPAHCPAGPLPTLDRSLEVSMTKKALMMAMLPLMAVALTNLSFGQ